MPLNLKSVIEDAMLHDSGRSLGIALPHVRDAIDFSFFLSFTAMLKPDSWSLITPDIPSGDFPQNVGAVREQLCEKGLSEGCTHLLFLDTDQDFPRDTIPKLLAHRMPVVVAPVHRRYPPFDHLLLRRVCDDESPSSVSRYALVPDEEAYSGKVVEIDATGAACMMIETAILKDIPRPWFKSPMEKGDPGEDIYFCEKVRESFIPIHADTSIRVDHVARIGINEQFRKMYHMLQKLQQKEASHGKSNSNQW
jgi:hypothetical protein